MKERPINLKAWEVRAIIDGRKTQFRRAVKWPLTSGSDGIKRRVLIQSDAPLLAEILKENGRSHPHLQFCPYGEPGDRLWVRETWGARFSHRDLGATAHHWNELSGPLARYRMQENLALYAMKADSQNCGGWIPSIHMPRWASRITLEVVSVRVERLNEISEEDAKAEGVSGPHNVGYPAFLAPGDSKPRYSKAVAAFESLWQSINGPGSWEANPWVWVVEFRQCE